MSLSTYMSIFVCVNDQQLNRALVGIFCISLCLLAVLCSIALLSGSLLVVVVAFVGGVGVGVGVVEMQAAPASFASSASRRATH